ncbi:23548_t:CDS:2, partial [Racocetra persica]
LNDLDRLLAWRKDVNNFNLYFVVPPDIFGTFLLQRYKTTKDKDCVKKRSSNAMSGDDENKETTRKEMNKDVKK